MQVCCYKPSEAFPWSLITGGPVGLSATHRTEKDGDW